VSSLSKEKPGVKINYYPHRGQMPFHLDRYKVRNRGLLGGTSSGKTRAGAFEAISWCVENPGCFGGIFAPTFSMIKRNVIPTFETLLGVSALELSPFVRRFHKTDMMVEFNTFTGNHRGRPSKVWFVGLERPEAAEGMNLDFAWLDEAGSVPKLEPARRSIMRRLRGSGRALPFDKSVPKNSIGMWVTTTPDEVGSDLYDFFENPDPEVRNPESRIYRMSLLDNEGNLGSTFIEEMKRTHPGELYRQYIEGLFAAVGSGSFRFDYAVHVVDRGEFDGAPYLLRQSGEPLVPLKAVRRKVNFGVDFGWTHPSCVLSVGFDGDDRAYVLDEFYDRRVSPQALVNEGVVMEDRWGHGTFWCDSSRPDNIAVMSREGLDARGNKSKRDDGIAELGGRFQDAGDGRRRLYVERGCVNLIKELQTYDPDKKERDHAVDALRYAVMGGKSGGGEIEALVGRRRR